MKAYEIVATYLNGCSGETHPITTFEEVELMDTDEYIKAKHGKDFPQFVKESRPGGQVVYTFDNGTVTYIYEFAEV